MVSMTMLAYAMDFWSKGQLKALFLEHEVKTSQKMLLLLFIATKQPLITNTFKSTTLIIYTK